MAEQPLLSIVVTSYTTERLNDIYELLDSVKTQTYSDIETIFVAERSTELCDKIKIHIQVVVTHNYNCKVTYECRDTSSYYAVFFNKKIIKPYI